MSRISKREKALLADALTQPAERRAEFLARACGEDHAMLARLTELVAANEGADRLLDAPGVGAAALHEEQSGDRIGHYKLLQRIGEGGCGVVWMAEQEEPVRRRVALKVIKLGMDTKAVVARFEAERQALAMMDHPNIAKVFDAGATDHGRPFFAMELVRGISITRYCDENHLTPAERLGLFVKVCHAVQHAHQKGIIHRDLKPSNILVTLNDSLPTPKIIDFGVAKATQGRLTDSTLFTAFEQFIGTPVYMSPEQAEMSSLDIDTRSDIYSLGILLYELLAGQPPFDPKAFARAGIDAIRQHILQDEPPRPSTRWRTLAEAERTTLARLRSTAPGRLSLILRGDLDWIVMRCIEKDRTRRYDTASGIAADVERYLRQEPITARPPSSTYLLQKLFRRHRMAFAAAGGIALAMVLGAAAAIWQAWRATQAQYEAQAAQRNEATLRRTAEAQEFVARQRAYVADMRLVQEALESDNSTRAFELLSQHRPMRDQRDVREWEWRYLWKEARQHIGDQDVLGESPGGVIQSLASSADGAWLAVGKRWRPDEPAGVVEVWDVRRRECCFKLQVGAADNLVKFSPRAPVLAISGRTLVAPAQSWVEFWNVPERRKEQRLDLDGQCAALAFSADGEVLLTATCGRTAPSSAFRATITRWRVREGEILGSIQTPNTFEQPMGNMLFYPFAISADLTLAAYEAAEPGTFRVIDVNTGAERWTGTMPVMLSVLAFSPDAKKLAVGCTKADGFALWDAATGTEIGALQGHRQSVHAVVFLPDGQSLVSASDDRTVKLWDLRTRRVLATRDRRESMPRSLELIRGTGWLVTGEGEKLRMWQPAVPPLDSIANAAAWRFAGDGRSVFAFHHLEGVIAEYALPDLRPLRSIEIDPPPLEHPADVVFAPDRPLIAFGSAAGVVQVFDFERRTHVAELKIGSGRVAPVGFFRGGERLIALQVTPSAFHEWDLARGVCGSTWRGPDGYAQPRRMPVALTPDEKQMLMLAPDGSGQIRDLVAGTSRAINVSLENAVAVRFCDDGRLLAAAGDKGVVKLWQFPGLQEAATLTEALYGVHSLAFSPNGRRLVTATGVTNEAAAIMWDVESRQPVLTLAARGMFVGPMRFSADGSVLGAMALTSVFNNGRLQLWQAPTWAEIEAAEKPAPAAGRQSIAAVEAGRP